MVDFCAGRHAILAPKVAAIQQTNAQIINLIHVSIVTDLPSRNQSASAMKKIALPLSRINRKFAILEADLEVCSVHVYH
jgi:hypothetical protein